MSAAGPVRRAAVSRDDWETPRALFELLDGEFGFDLDGAANASNAKVKPWLGPGSAWPDAFVWPAEESRPRRIFVNPPYGAGLERWVELFGYRWAKAGHLVVALLPNATDTSWFWSMAGSAAEVRLLTSRVQFVGTTSSNPSGSVVAVWTPLRWASFRMWDWKEELRARREGEGARAMDHGDAPGMAMGMEAGEG